MQFQTSFDLVPRPGESGLDLLPRARGMVGDWIARSRAIPGTERGNVVQYLNDELFSSDSEFQSTASGVILATKALSSDDSQEASHWGMSFQHPDSEFPNERLWRTDITLTRLSNQDVRISLTVSYFPPHGILLREIPEAKYWGPPALIKALMASTWLDLYSGMIPMRQDVIQVGPGQSSNFRALVEDKNRTLPVILVSRSLGTDAPGFARRLAKELVGQAIILCEDVPSSKPDWTLRSDFQNNQVSESIPATGAVGIYLPSFEFKKGNTATQLQFLQVECLRPEDPTFYDSLRRNLTRMAYVNLRAHGPNNAMTVWDIARMKRFARIHELRDEIHTDVQHLSTPSAPMSLEYMQELIALYETELGKLQHELSSGQNELAKSQYELTEARAELEKLKQIPPQKFQRTEIIHLDTKPFVIEEVNDNEHFTNLVAQLYANRLAFSTEALKDVKKLKFDKPEILLHMLVALATDLYTLVYVDKNPGFFEEFRNRTKFEISNEGSLTRADSEIKRDRMVTINGKTFSGWMHLKYGIKEPNMIRVYFDYDNATRRIVIARIATHLRTSGSSRNGSRGN